MAVYFDESAFSDFVATLDNLQSVNTLFLEVSLVLAVFKTDLLLLIFSNLYLFI